MKYFIQCFLKSRGWFELFSAILLFFFILNIPAVYGQSSHERPKIGLALSGGGSCGIAHLGVIKVMEEAGLRPDLITGVSMGSIIGGLYAAGYSSDSLEKLCRTIDWDLIMSNRFPDSKIIYPEKNHFHNCIITLPVTLKKSMIPAGLNNGQQLENVLNYYGWPAALITDFKDLPIPFMCMATDLVTCKMVELTEGYLPDAIRASTSVPTIFTPVRIANRTLIDGGFIRNLAVSEARDMGADFVIGSYTGSYMSKKEELQNMKDVLAQLLFFVGVYDFEDQKKYADILIEPKTGDILSTSFLNIDTIIKRGYDAALPYKDMFKKLADSLNQIGTQKPPHYILDRQYYKFDTVIVRGNKRVSTRQILGILDIQKGELVDKNFMKEKIDFLYGNAWFDKINYRIEPANDSLSLVIDCTEAPATTFYGSVHYDDALHSGLVIGFTVRNPLFKKSLIDINSYIGHFYKAAFSYTQFFDHDEKFGISSYSYAEGTYIPRLELYDETGGTLNRAFSQSVSLSERFGLNHILSTSVKYENLSLIPDYISRAGLKNINSQSVSVLLDYRVNTLNTRYYPDRGIVAQVTIADTRLFSTSIKRDSVTDTYNYDLPDRYSFSNFTTLYGYFNQYISLSKKLTVGIRGSLLSVSNTDSISSKTNFYFLGGIEPVNVRTIPMTGFHCFQFPVRNLAGIGLNLDYEVINKLHISLDADFFRIKDIREKNESVFIKGFGLGAGYMSIIGPLRGGIMLGMNENEKYFKSIKGYISLGYTF